MRADATLTASSLPPPLLEGEGVGAPQMDVCAMGGEGIAPQGQADAGSQGEQGHCHCAGEDVWPKEFLAEVCEEEVRCIHELPPHW